MAYTINELLVAAIKCYLVIENTLDGDYIYMPLFGSIYIVNRIYLFFKENQS